MRTRFALLLCFALTALPAAAQGGSVTGRVVDGATGDGLPQATVALYDAEGGFVTGTATAADGAFSVERLPTGTYRVRASFVGYASAEREDVAVAARGATDVGTLALTEDPALLGEAEVTAEREFVTQQADRTVYNVAEQPVTAGGSAIETLQTLPSVEVDTDGNLSLRGNQNVAVHVNGRPVPVKGQMLAAMLRQIPASNVARVEVMPNPSARHEPDGMSGIINIVMKEGTSRGLSGGLTLGGGSAPNGEASGNVAYQRGRVDAYASYGFRYDAFDLAGTSSRVSFLPAGDSQTGQVLAIDNGTRSHLGSAQLDYTLAKRTTLGLTGTLGVRDGSADQALTYTFGAGTGSETQSERVTDGDVSGYNAEAATNLDHRWADDHTLTAEARFSRNTDDREELFADFDRTAGTEARTRNAVDQRTDEASAQLDYVRPIGDTRLEAGAKATLRRLDNARRFTRHDGAAWGAPRTDDFRYDEDVYAAYVQAARAFGPLELQAGLRAEAATATLADAAAVATDRSYESLYPSAFALYTLGQGSSVKASYSRRVNRPQAWQLNPLPRFEDTLFVDVGNPNLRPEYTDAFELTLQYRHLVTLAPFYRYTSDVIRRRVNFDAEAGRTTVFFQNLDTESTYGADLTVMPRLGPVRGFVSASVYRSVTDGGSIETGLGADGIGWSARGNLQWQVRKGTDVQLFGFYRAPLVLEDGRISGFGITSLGLSQQLLGDRLRLNVRLNDMLGTARFEFRTGTDEYALSGVREPQIQQVSASLTYTFGQASKKRRPQPQPQQQQGGGIGF